MTGLEERNTGGAATSEHLQGCNGQEAAELFCGTSGQKPRPRGGNHRQQIFLIVLTMVTVATATGNLWGGPAVVPGTMHL